jgi:hypothetical protein
MKQTDYLNHLNRFFSFFLTFVYVISILVQKKKKKRNFQRGKNFLVYILIQRFNTFFQIKIRHN